MRVKARKQTIQAVALLMTSLAAVPIYFGLQGEGDALTWAGLFLAVAGMALGLWIG